MQEQDWIARYIAPLVTAPGAAALKDDVAILSANAATIATLDTLVCGVHFLAEDPLFTVGQKLVRVNVSDIYAKGALPAEAMLSIAWPSTLPETAFEALLAGLAQDLQYFDIALMGGDLVRTDGPLVLTLTLTGVCLKDAPVRRSGGQPGDGLFVDGQIGWGGLGLAAARRGQNSEAARRYRVPEISSAAAAATVAERARASMDVSDGLLLDLDRMCSASGCGAVLELDKVPLAEVSNMLDVVLAHCTAGDDYRILMAADPTVSYPGFTRIGHLTQSPGLKLSFQDESVSCPEILGFQHD